MIGRPFRMEWHEEDTPAALKRTYLSQRDVSIRTRLHVLWLIRCDWQIKAAQRLWEFTIAAHRDGWSGTEKAASTKLCLARWEVWVSRGF